MHSNETPHDALILCYHAVSEDWGARLSVSPSALEEQLRFLIDRGYRGATFSECATGNLPGKVVAVTFDDAYRSVYELARPVLERLGMPGTVFVPTAFIGSSKPMSWSGIDQWVGTEDEENLVPISVEQARALADAGWEIGSHTRTHPRLPQLSDAELADELERSKSDCEALTGRECRSIAFPYGAYDDRVVAAAVAAGYEAAAGMSVPWRAPTPLGWPRIGVYQLDSSRYFRLKVSRWARRLYRAPFAPKVLHLLHPVSEEGVRPSG